MAQPGLEFAPESDWATIFYQRHGKHWQEKRGHEKYATWIVRDQLPSLQRFSRFPFQRLRTLQVLIRAPDPNDPGRMFWLWHKAASLSQMLNQARQVERIHIRHHAYDDSTHWDRFSSAFRETSVSQMDLDMVLPGFLALQNVGSLYTSLYQVHPQQKAMTATIWRDPLTLTAIGKILIWLQIHQIFWSRSADQDPWGISAEWVKSALTQDPSPFIEFQKRYWQTLKRFPVLIMDHDRLFLMVKDMHLAIVALYHYATEKYHDPQGPASQRPMHVVFQNWQCVDVEYDMALEGRYREYMRLYGYYHEPEVSDMVKARICAQTPYPSLDRRSFWSVVLG
ncbi:hypothetical protein P170DRAFT_422134 [Aspergillus steynii IBT 23096]|uniref:Uncharacterized protein n=1 Tax=Aspergillus steynii IBT 23096 TaxID=1392250 RepID=A0A2I2GRV2_9EURO|nr:uncharacterized protein P170DRAFT_422134 [Aspergillus steynii IBT 23096]PLB55600.1 hypothetical protein P170DRAFT_422134 [Aspergillus steynii IBT 23096]